MNFVIAHN